MAAPLVTSGQFSATQSVVTLLNRALRNAQVIGAEETATGAQLQNGLEAMTAMCKGWQGSGIHVWCEEEGILFLQTGQTLYSIGAGSPDNITLWDTLIQSTLALAAASGANSLTVSNVSQMNVGDNIGVQMISGFNYFSTITGIVGSVVSIAGNLPAAAAQGAIVFDYTIPLYRPLRIMGGRRYNYLSKLDIPMQTWARLDYQAQPNKYSTGVPTAYFYDPQTGSGSYSQPVGQWNSWPTPQDNTFGARFTAQRPIQDIGSLANIPDFPVEWNSALMWNLALEIAPENGVPTEQLTVLAAAAKKWYDMASQWDREPESILFGVAFSPGQRR
jgi:hypothetical protein